MINWGSYLPGLGQDQPEEEESAVAKTLRLLGQAPEALGDVGRAAGAAVGSYLPTLGAQPAAPQPEPAATSAPPSYASSVPEDYSSQTIAPGPVTAPFPHVVADTPDQALTAPVNRYLTPTQTETEAVTSGLQTAWEMPPVGPEQIGPITVPNVVRRGLGAASGVMEAAGGVQDYAQARGVEPLPGITKGFARDGILVTDLSPEQYARYNQLLDPTSEDGRRRFTLTPDEQAELQGYQDYAEQKYQQIKDDPDALMRYFHAARGSTIVPAIAGGVLAPAVGGLAAGAGARVATSLGAGARTARAIGYGADIAAQTAVDPTTPFLQGPLDAAGAAVRAGRRLPGAIGSALETPGARAAAEAPGVQHLGSGVVPAGEGFGTAAVRGTVHQAPEGAPTWNLPEGVTETRTPISAGLASGYSPDDIRAFYVNRRWSPEWDADPSLVPPVREGFPPYTRERATQIAEREFQADLTKEPPAVRALVNGDQGVQHLGSGVVPELPRAPSAPALPEALPPRPSPNISPLGQRVHDTYTAVTPARTQAATDRTVQIASDAIAARIPRKGGMQTAPTDLVRSVHDTIVKNLQDTKIVATGIRPGAIQAYLRGEGLTSKVDTRDLAQINEITKGQVNVAGGRAGEPYTLSQAADFAQRESEQMRVATGGTRFPDPETGMVDEEAPRVMYGYVSEGQPLVGPNRPTVWLVWDDDTPRITSAHHPYGLTSPGQDIHASMPPGLKAAIWSENAIQGARHGPAVMEGGRLVEAAPGVPGTSPMAFGWEQAGVDVGGGRKIADTNWLVGPEGEDAMRANGLILGMPQTMQRAIAGGAMTDPEEIAAILMRGGSPKWKGGWGAVMNPSRSESLILDPDITKVKALYITGTPKDLAAKLTGGGRTGPQITELGVAQKLRQDILAATKGEKDIPILFNDVSKSATSAAQQAAGATLEGWSPRLISDAQLLEGPPMTLAPGRAGIRDRYVATGLTDIGGGVVPRLRADAFNFAQGGVMGGASEVLQAQEEGRDVDPAEMARRALLGGGLAAAGGRYARGRAGQHLGSGVVPTPGGFADDVRGAARRARIAARGPLPELPEGALPIRATPEAEVSRLRLDLFPPEVRSDIQAAAEGSDYARTQRRGVLPDEAVSRLADDDARSVDDLIKGGKMGRAYNPEETVAIRNAVASQADRVRDLSTQIAESTAAGTTPDLLIARRAAESTKLQALVQVAEGARAEAGRTLRQYAQQAKLIELDPNAAIARIRGKITDPDEFAKIVDEYTQAVNDGADPIVMAKLWSKVERGEIKAGDIFALYRRFNMLSGPRTFEVNALSGGLNLGYEMLGQAAQQGVRGRLGESAAELGAPFKAGARAFKNMAETMWHGVSAEQAARGDIPRNLSSRTENPALKAALTTMEIPDRLNAGVDQFFRTLTEDWAATILAHKQARTAGLKPGSPGWADAVADNLAKIREDPSTFPEVKAMADRVTFSEEPGGVVKGLEDLKRRSPNLVGFVAPFIRTPANIASRAVDISPLGPVRTAVEAATGMGRGRANLSQRVRDNTIGTAATAWAYTQAQQGNITGAGPDDPEKLAELRATGWQPYSIKIGDQYWSYANFAPFSLALSAGAAASEAQKYAKPGKEDVLSMLADGAARTGKVVTDMTVLAGLGAVIKAQQDPDRYGTQWLTTALTQLMPAGSLVNTIGQATDPLVRRSERTDVGTQVSQNLQARVPGLRETVPAAQDPLGRDIPNERLGIRAVYPSSATTERDEPVLQAFLASGVDIGKPPDRLTVPNLRDPALKPVLTPEEQRRWNTLRGEAIIRRVTPMVADPTFATAPAEARQKALEKQRTEAADEAHARLRSEIGAQEINRRISERQRAS